MKFSKIIDFPLAALLVCMKSGKYLKINLNRVEEDGVKM